MGRSLINRGEDWRCTYRSRYSPILSSWCRRSRVFGPSLCQLNRGVLPQRMSLLTIWCNLEGITLLLYRLSCARSSGYASMGTTIRYPLHSWSSIRFQSFHNSYGHHAPFRVSSTRSPSCTTIWRTTVKLGISAFCKNIWEPLGIRTPCRKVIF